MKSRYANWLPAIALVTVIGVSSCEKNDIAAPIAGTDAQRTAQADENNYVVTLKPEFAGPGANGRIHSIVARYKLNPKLHRTLTGKAFNGFVLALSEAELERLKNDPAIESIQPDFTITVNENEPDSQVVMPPVYTITPDSGQNVSWGATLVGIGDGAATGRSAWIVDSGIQLNHPDLNVDVARSRSFVSGVSSPADQFGHGTNVAGILGAINNNFGVVGIAAGANLVSVRVLGATGTGTLSAVLAGLNYIAANAAPEDVVNISLAYGNNTTVDNAVRNVANQGIYVVVAAGNSGVNCAGLSPARVQHTNVFTVSGLRPDGSFMAISNYGFPVDYCAPGTALPTTKINSAYSGGVGGTSMAAPHVGGILLVRGATNIPVQGYVTGDPDGVADPIPHM